ncbi:MAG TPA: alpha-amylase/4-alpha-glucanotransferase domain-containing protein, partial [Pirellulales bacterium]
PGSERLRYLIPFADPWETVNYLRSIAEQTPNAVLVFGDDGEKFGTWPDTKAHVYQYGWLSRFFEALLQNQDWIKVTTLAEAIDNVAPVGKVYLPNASYREMVEWSLPAERLVEYEHMTHEQNHLASWPSVQKFLRGGFWRNFKIKYPETDEMYCRMLGVSRRLKTLEDSRGESDLLEQAKLELYRGQCNCPYWHGAFGGLYLPHLRAAIYEHLIAADTLLDKVTRSSEQWVEVKAEDFNLDARQEVLLANDRLYALFAPVQGGMMYELDVRAIKVNLGATITRRPEAYHRKILAGAHGSEGAVASIHDRVVFKQPDLDRKLIYDRYPRKSLIDHFYDNDVSLAALSEGTAMERGDFAGGVYEAVLRRGPQRAQVQMTKVGNAWGHPLTIVKTITLDAGGDVLKIDYELQNLPTDRAFHFAIELNFAGLPAGADDRYFHDGAGHRHGRLGTLLDLSEAKSLHLVDEWLGIDVGVNFSRPSGVYTFPVQTVSQSEGGFELVHQSVSLQPHWLVQGDAEGRWRVSIDLKTDCSLAESRRPAEPAAAIV